jgi:uncharacterized protein (DUF427 family)
LKRRADLEAHRAAPAAAGEGQVDVAGHAWHATACGHPIAGRERIVVMERVWDYPRPPAVVACERRVRVEVGGTLVADSRGALRVLETSHPPTVYVPPQDVRAVLVPGAARSTWCEFKGRAVYLDIVVSGRHVASAGWTYPDPAPGYEALRDHVAFYPGRVEAWLDDERVEAQEGDFYGGWITADLVGPFKGPAGTLAW